MKRERRGNYMVSHWEAFETCKRKVLLTTGQQPLPELERKGSDRYLPGSRLFPLLRNILSCAQFETFNGPCLLVLN
jgi:hypothetical protein